MLGDPDGLDLHLVVEVEARRGAWVIPGGSGLFREGAGYIPGKGGLDSGRGWALGLFR